MEAELIIVGGKANKAKVAIKPPTMIGRSRNAGLTIAHRMISRQHCEVFEVDGLLMIRDLGSLNGTVVTGQRIKESPLPPDAEFTVGPLTFRTHYQYSGDLSKLPAAVLDDSRAAKAPAAAEEFEELDIIEELEEIEEPKTAPTSTETITGTVKEQKAESPEKSDELPDDFLEDFLKGID